MRTERLARSGGPHPDVHPPSRAPPSRHEQCGQCLRQAARAGQQPCSAGDGPGDGTIIGDIGLLLRGCETECQRGGCAADATKWQDGKGNARQKQP